MSGDWQGGGTRKNETIDRISNWSKWSYIPTGRREPSQLSSGKRFTFLSFQHSLRHHPCSHCWSQSTPLSSDAPNSIDVLFTSRAKSV